MAVIDIHPQPFFKNKNRAFWNLQLAGWAAAFVLRATSTIANGQMLSDLVPVFISVMTGYSISLLLSVVYKYLFDRKPLLTWGLTALLIIVATSLYAFIDAWVFLIQNLGTESGFGTIFLGAFFIDFIMLAAWSALYYAINFFLRVEEQNDQLLWLQAQATQAQLAMLRYQLNPHFLFNTLNSISTLVLLKETERANAMLSRLSSFLRHTLVNEVHARVPLYQEVETLGLYLDIEKMRFEDRLRAHFDIAADVRQARLPSLLLQPLVENAIKYAVTPQEDGADISITAKKNGKKVRITVSDTGLGQADVPVVKKESTGVGLDNIQERLNQAYGDQHHFEIISSPDQGFSVVIEIPIELEADVKTQQAEDDTAFINIGSANDGRKLMPAKQEQLL